MFQIQRIEEVVGKGHVRSREMLSGHTTFRIGGPAQWFVEPLIIEDLVLVVHYLREQGKPYYILGNGSNILVDDAGIDGVVVCTHSGRGGTLEGVECFEEEEEMHQFFFQRGYCTPEEIQGKRLVSAGSGALLSQVASKAAKAGLAGLEFASGIPGTLGGAVTMNAGAYGGEIQDVIVAARVLCQDGQIRILGREELELGYRSSIIQRENMIVLDVLFALQPGEEQQIRAVMKEYNDRRKEKQPLEYGSAGSTFKRPEGYFAGKLIQDAGLRGYRVGDVMVSEKHCGFVVNVGNGTYAQAEQVIEHVQKTVYEQFGVELETEVKIWKMK